MTETVIDYVIVFENSIDVLTRQVKKYLMEGYQPHGFMLIDYRPNNRGSYFQAMILKCSDPEIEARKKALLAQSVDCLEFTKRVANCLKSESIYTVEDLVSMTETYLLKVPNLGKHCIMEIKDVLHSKGLKLKQI